jgi:hypothetical protein
VEEVDNQAEEEVGFSFVSWLGQWANASTRRTAVKRWTRRWWAERRSRGKR